MSVNQTPQAIAQHIGNATGALGFLKWVEAVFPAPVAAAVLKAAAQHPMAKQTAKLGTLGLEPLPPLIAAYAREHNARVARAGLRGLGQAGANDFTTSWDQYANLTGSGVNTSSVPAASSVATSAPASTSWLSSIGSALSSAISLAGQAYLTKAQVDAQSQIVNANLTRAQQGLPPLPYTQQQLGLTGPTLNVGVSSSTMTPLLWGGGILAGILLLGTVLKHR